MPTDHQPPHPAFEVFLSHATSDVEHTELVRRQIEALGARVYLAEHDPQPGTSLAEKVDAALQRAALVVVLVTSTSVNSNYVQQEIGVARAYRKPIIPIVDSRIAGKIDLAMLAGVEYLELDVSQPAEAMARITASLRSLVFAPTPSLELTAAPVALQPSSPPAVVPLVPTTFSDTEKLVLVGLAVVLALLFLGEGGASTA